MLISVFQLNLLFLQGKLDSKIKNISFAIHLVIYGKKCIHKKRLLVTLILDVVDCSKI